MLAVNNEDDSGHVADANKSKPDGLSPLHMAAMNGHAAIASELLGAGAEKDALEDSDPDDYMPDGGGRSPWLLQRRKAMPTWWLSCWRLVPTRKSRPKKGETPLWSAAGRGGEPVVAVLIEAGADVNTPTLAGE